MGQTAKGLFWETEKQSRRAIRAKGKELDEMDSIIELELIYYLLGN